MQINFSEAVLKMVSVHYVGNKGNGQEVRTTDIPIALTIDEGKVIKEAFLGKFNLETDKYSFKQ
jgi:hypothetical protein